MKVSETHHIRHTFTKDEKLELALKLTTAMSEIENKEEILKDFARSVKDQIAEQEAIVTDCAQKIREGYVMNDVECHLTYEVENCQVKYIAKGTGEVLDTRPMTDEEQLRLAGSEVKEEGGDS